MTRRRRVAVVALVAVALLAAATQLHVSLPRTLEIVGPGGRPLAEAWVGYHFRGRRFATVQSNTWERPGALLRTVDGKMELPLRIHLRSWPFDSGPERVIDLVYAPRLHNASGPLGEPARPDRVRVVGDRLELADLSQDPAAWAETLRTLYGFVVFEALVEEEEGPWSTVRPGTVADLANGVAAEYLAFRRRWGQVPRLPPAAPAELAAGSAERTAWDAQVAADLAAAPLWDDHLGNRWHDDLRYMRSRVAEVQASDATPPP